MTIQNTDLFLVNTSGGATIAGSKKCEAQNLNGKNGDVLVNRGGVSHKTGIVNIPTTVLDTDLMLVNRGGASFKATGADVQTLFPQGPAGGTDVITDVVDTEIAGAWTSASAAEANQWRSVTYGNGKFVAVADGGTNRVMYSDDGITWTAASAAAANRWYGVTYGDGKFVAVAAVAAADANRVMYSDDGITWSNAGVTGVEQSNQWRSVTYGNGKFVAVSYDGTNRVMYSADGITWTAASAAEANQWYGVTYGDGKFVAVAGTGTNRVMYSDDGITWYSATATENSNWYTVTYGDGKFVAVASSGTNLVMYSPDGISWSNAGVTGVEANTWLSVTYGDGKFVAVSYDGTNRVMYSYDGISWTGASAVEANGWYGVTYGDGKFVAVAGDGTNRVMWSYTGTGEVGYKSDLTLASDKNLDTFTPGDGLQMVGTDGNTAAYVPVTSAITAATPETLAGGWTAASAPEANSWFEVTYGNGKFVAVSYSGTNKVMYSYDGITWSSTGVTGAAGGWRSLTYGDGKFLAVGQTAPYVMYSDDGISWTSASASTQLWSSVTYGGTPGVDGKFVAVSVASGATSTAMYSDDGISWTAVLTPEANTWVSVTYGNGKFVAVSQSGTNRVMWSPDGIAWTAASAATANTWESVTYDDGKFVAVASDGPLVMYSTDGISWTAAFAASPSRWQSVTYGDGKFVAVAEDGIERVMYSTDGIDWISASAAENNGWYGVTYGDGKFVAVGIRGTNQVMWSYTGTNVNEDENITTLALTPTSKDLKYFNPGDKVTQAANFGTVKSVGTDELVLTDTTLAGGWTNAGMASYPWRCITYGEGKFVAVAYDTSYSDVFNRIAYSSNGITWKYSNVAAAVIWQGVAYGGGKFVSVGYSYNLINGALDIYDHIMYSDDGITWAMSAVNSIPSNGFLYSVTYGADKFVAVGVDKFMYSTDAINWTTATAPTTVDQSWTSVTYGNGKFVAVSSTSTTINRVMYSPDGINWTQAAAAAQLSWQAVTYGNGMFVAIANSGSNCVMYSSDGINWTSSSVEAEPNKAWSTVAYGNGKFVALTSSENLTMHSTDGITWSAVTNSGLSGNLSGWAGLAYGGNKFAAVASSGTNRAMYSYTGTIDDEVSDWTTSVGQAAELDKSLSGTGTYSEHTGSVLTVGNSNTEWVDNDNQRGDDYYATTQTTRLSLAKALTIDDYGVMTASARQWAATAIAGYYPLFRFERIAKLVGDGTAHNHTFDGVTWYMPNGVTYYHGDYSG